MLDCYLQQWTAIQTVRAANLQPENVVAGYLNLTASTGQADINGYLAGQVIIATQDRDLVAQAINELLDMTESFVDGAHYSTDSVTADSGFGEYLRTLTLSPDNYDFHAPAAKDDSTGAQEQAEQDFRAADELAGKAPEETPE
jgi:hypothetical protein